MANLIARDLRVAVEAVQNWVTQAGYDIIQWVQSVFSIIQQALTIDDSTAVEVHNVRHGGMLPADLTLTSASVKDGRWVVSPPAIIPAGKVARFYLKDNLGLKGSDGQATYAYVDTEGRRQSVTFEFGCPYPIWLDNFARSSQSVFNVYAKSGEGSPRWGGAGQVPKKGHPVYVAYVWGRGPAPG